MAVNISVLLLSLSSPSESSLVTSPGKDPKKPRVAKDMFELFLSREVLSQIFLSLSIELLAKIKIKMVKVKISLRPVQPDTNIHKLFGVNVFT